MAKLLASEQFRFMMQTQPWLPSLAEPRPPAPPRSYNEQAMRDTRWPGDGPRPIIVMEQCVVRQGEMIPIWPYFTRNSTAAAKNAIFIFQKP